MKECCTEIKLESKNKNIVLVGNPNVGKSLIFNSLTGAHQTVANFPGITLEHTVGTYKNKGNKFSLVDLPGVYGFNTSNLEEMVSQEYLVANQIDLLVNVVDATKLERNLFLTLQLLELNKNMIVVLNYYDKVSKKQIEIDVEGLENDLGIPVIPFTATDAKSYDKLKERIDESLEQSNIAEHISLGNEIDQILDAMVLNVNLDVIKEKHSPYIHYMPPRLLALLALAGSKRSFLPDSVLTSVHDNINSLGLDLSEELFHLKIISAQYNLIDQIVDTNVKTTDMVHSSLMVKIDNILLHKYYGFIVFIGVMFAVFKITFDLSAPLSGYLEYLATSLADFVWLNVSNELLASFLADGLIGGVGFVLVFIPQIAFLFMFLSILEHTGYMARVVFITDRFLNRMGISGKSIAPMLLGFGCNIPAILSTRNIKDQNERITMILINPFFSCSARLPVYVVFASAVFREYAGLVIAAMYFTGIIIAISLMFVLRKTFLKGETPDLLLELNDLSPPTVKAVLGQTYRQVKKFIENAATWMALGLILIWILSITGPSGYLGPDALNSPELLELSWIYWIGDFFQPLFGFFGWDTRLVVALLFGFIAKEIVVGSLGLIYGVGGNLVALQVIIAAEFSPVSAIAFMLFILTYTPCIGTFFAIKQEIGIKWALFSLVIGLIIAFTLAFLTIIIGGLF